MLATDHHSGMAIKRFRTEKEFGEHLTRVLSPAKPVDAREMLYGRDEQLTRVSRALYAEGRHVFIYGDRGVGKSSLAKTAASAYRDGQKDYLFVSCEHGSTLFSVMHSLAKLVIESNAGQEKKRSHEITLGWGPLKYRLESDSTTSGNDLPAPGSLDDCIQLLIDIVNLYGPQSIAVIDEFDAIDQLAERQRFADLLKRMGDRNVGLKFILSGIAASLDDLLGGHLSSIRQLETVPLEPLNWTARFAIIQAAAGEFGIQVPESIRIRIAAISNGFPHYVHLLTEKLLWQMFDDPGVCEEARTNHFRASLDTAVASISPHLKRPYEQATQRVSEDYRDSVWAAADAYDLQRHSSRIFESYVWVCQQLEKDPLPRGKFVKRLNELKKNRYGGLLRNLREKAGWYEFSENMVRGFVRLKAEQNGVQLRDHEYDKEPKALTARAPTMKSHQASRKDYAPPVKFRGEVNDDDDTT